MTSNINSIAPYVNANPNELLDTIGITQFSNGTDWFQVLGGLIFQGGLVSAHSSTATVTFPTGFSKQTLCVIVQPKDSSGTTFYVTSVTLKDFVLAHGGGGVHNYYWFAIGV